MANLKKEREMMEQAVQAEDAADVEDVEAAEAVVESSDQEISFSLYMRN